MRSRNGQRTINQKVHAQIRSKQRLGFTLTHAELKALASRVRAGEFVRAGVQGREVWRVDVRGISCEVVFDPERRHIVSFLPIPKAAPVTQEAHHD